MGESLLFRAIASSALVLGALVGARFQLPDKVLAATLALAAGALITALSFELFEDSYEQGGIWRAAVGLAAGAVVFTVISSRLDRAPQGSPSYRPRQREARRQRARPKSQQVPGRLVVRRIPALNPNGQDGLFEVWRFHAFFTTSTLDAVTADKTHRGHAIIEQVHADLQHSALTHLPSGKLWSVTRV